MFYESLLESDQRYLFIRCVFPETIKTKCISNPFLLSIYNVWHAFIQACVINYVPLFGHVRPIEVGCVW